MLPAGLGLIVSPLVGSLLLEQDHFFHGLAAIQGADGQDGRKNGGGEGDPPGKFVTHDLFHLFGLGEFNFSHSGFLS